MSLKARLSIAIMGLVTIVVVVLSTMNVTRVLDQFLEDLRQRAELNAKHLRDNILDRIQQNAAGRTSTETLEETKHRWVRSLERDPIYRRLLERAVVDSNLAVEIYVSDEGGRVLATSNPLRGNQTAEALPEFDQWSDRSLLNRVRQVVLERNNYVISMPIGLSTETDPIFTIKVILSSVLIRNALMPELRGLAVTWVVALLASLAVAILFSNIVLQPIGRLSRAIDHIRKGESSLESAQEDEAREFAELRSKLGTLARDFMGARQDVSDLRANVTQLIERLEETVIVFGRDGRLRSAGASAEKLLGRSRLEMEDLPVAAVFPATEPLGEAIQEAVRSRRPFQDRPFLLNRGGRAGRLLVTVKFLEDHPAARESGMMVILRDAESRRQIVSQVVDISNRMAAIRRLTSGVAHEMKNPLNAIALEVEVLKSRLGAVPEAESLKPDMESMDREIARLDRVIKTFLEFTQPVELQLQPLKISEVVREAVQIEREAADRRGVQIETRDDSDGAMILADLPLVAQAVRNILANAIEATPHGGKLRVDIELAAGEVVLNVRDQGPGIPPNIRDRVFDLYFTTKQDSAGVGLAVAAQVVQLHGGTIDCVSEAGDGTTFRLRFPSAEMREATEAQ